MIFVVVFTSLPVLPKMGGIELLDLARVQIDNSLTADQVSGEITSPDPFIELDESFARTSGRFVGTTNVAADSPQVEMYVIKAQKFNIVCFKWVLNVQKFFEAWQQAGFPVSK